MGDGHDFSGATKNPYAPDLTSPVTVQLDADTIEYFEQIAEDTGFGYQTLIGIYPRDCAASGRRLSVAGGEQKASGNRQEEEELL